MKPSENGQGKLFRVIVSASIRQKIEFHHEKASEEGWETEFIATLEKINFRLRTDPYNFGEPLYRLPGLKLLVCLAALNGLVVVFGIHQKMPLIFLKGFSQLD